MDSNIFNRQLTLIDPAKLDFSIAVVGAGGIGSWTALALMRLGCQDVTVIDFDVVEEHNVGSQLYTEKDVGTNKVKALAKKLDNLAANGNKITTISEKMEEGDLYRLLQYDVVILAVDDIATRKLIFEALKGTPVLLIDGRMAGNAIEIYAGLGNNEAFCNFYNTTLFPNEEAVPLPCTERSVVYNCFVMAGMITDLVARRANEQPLPKELVIDLANFTMFNEGGT